MNAERGSQMAKPTYSFEFTPARSTAGSSHSSAFAIGTSNNQLNAIKKAASTEPENGAADTNNYDAKIGFDDVEEEETDGTDSTDVLAVLVADYASRHGEEPSDEVLKQWKSALSEAAGIDCEKDGEDARESDVGVDEVGASDSEKASGDEEDGEDGDGNVEEGDAEGNETDGPEPTDVLALLVADYASRHGEDPSDEVLKQWKSALSEAVGGDSGIRGEDVNEVQAASSDDPNHIFSNITSTQSSSSSLPGLHLAKDHSTKSWSANGGGSSAVANTNKGTWQPSNSFKLPGQGNASEVNLTTTAVVATPKALFSHNATVVVEGLPENAIEYGGVYSRRNVGASGNVPGEWLSTHTGVLGKPYRLYRSAQSGRWLLGWRQASTEGSGNSNQQFTLAGGALAPDASTGTKKKKNKRKGGAAKARSDVAHQGQCLNPGAVEGAASGAATNANAPTGSSIAGADQGCSPTLHSLAAEDESIAGFRSEDCSAAAPELCAGGWQENAGADCGGWVQAPSLTVRVSSSQEGSPGKKQRSNGSDGWP